MRQKQQPASPMLGDNSRSSNNKSQLLTESTKTPTNQTAKANHSTKQSSNHSASQPTKLTSSRVMQWVWDWQPQQRQQRQLAPSPSRQCKQIFMYQKNDKLIELTLKAEINYTTVSCRVYGNVGRQGWGERWYILFATHSQITWHAVLGTHKGSTLLPLPGYLSES